MNTWCQIFLKGFLKHHWFIISTTTAVSMCDLLLQTINCKSLRPVKSMSSPSLTSNQGPRAAERLTNANIHRVANIITEPKKPTYWHLPYGYFYIAKHEYAFLPQTWERKICPICVTKSSARWPNSIWDSWEDHATEPPTFCSGISLLSGPQDPLWVQNWLVSGRPLPTATHLQERRVILYACLSKSNRRDKQAGDKSWKGFRLSPPFLPKALV